MKYKRKANLSAKNCCNISELGSLVCKAKLSVFLRFAFIVAFLLSLNGCQDPVMTKRIILKAVLLILMTGLLVLTFFAF